MSAFRAAADSSPALNSFPSDFGGIQLAGFKALSPRRITEYCWVLYMVFMWFGVEREQGVRLSELDNRNVGTHIRED